MGWGVGDMLADRPKTPGGYIILLIQYFSITVGVGGNRGVNLKKEEYYYIYIITEARTETEGSPKAPN